jgi:hypothetical protein
MKLTKRNLINLNELYLQHSVDNFGGGGLKAGASFYLLSFNNIFWALFRGGRLSRISKRRA